MYWDRAQGRSNGQTIPGLFVGLPFIHADAEDFVYFVDGQHVYRPSQPVH